VGELDKLLILAGASLALGVVVRLLGYQAPVLCSRELALFRDPRLVPLEPIPIPAN